MRGGCSRSFAGAHRGSCVDAALTRASRRLQKKAQPPRRLPSPWTEAVDFLDLGARASKKVEHWRARLCGKQRKSTASGQGEGSESEDPEKRCGVRMVAERPETESPAEA